MRLFVYGTLQDPQRLRCVVGRDVRVRVLGPATVCGMLYDAGDYPALLSSQSPLDSIPGVLLELDDERLLIALDRYEGVDTGLYVRQRLEVRLDDEQPQGAWVYVYNQSVAGLRRITRWPAAADDSC